MSIYIFKQVPSYEVDKLQSFIQHHWKKGHPLAVSKRLLNFQHYNEINNKYNFIVAENKQTSEYDAIVGFIPTAQYDKSLLSNGDYWGAIWKIRDDIKNSEISIAGFYLWKSLFKLPNFQSYAAIGISEIAKKIYIASRMTISHLNHFYILNDEIDSFHVAGNVNKDNIHNDCLVNDTTEIRSININDIKNSDVTPIYRPQKSLTYLKQRYANHPFYKYDFLGLFQGRILLSIWVIRKITIGNSSVLRVVDVLGELKGRCKQSLINLLHETGCEYIDFLNYGIDINIFYELGFNLLDYDGDLIIPNYFEPFEQRNVKFDIAYKAKYDNYVAFKADSDQDRPNIIPDNYE